jgi:hypothetical protein
MEERQPNNMVSPSDVFGKRHEAEMGWRRVREVGRVFYILVSQSIGGSKVEKLGRQSHGSPTSFFPVLKISTRIAIRDASISFELFLRRDFYGRGRIIEGFLTMLWKSWARRVRRRHVDDSTRFWNSIWVEWG